MLFSIAGKKQFVRSTGMLIQDQLSHLPDSDKPDFIWQGINQSRPDLYRFMAMLQNISSSFFQVSNISIYSRLAEDSSAWYRLSFPDGPTLKSSRIGDNRLTARLDRWLDRRFHRTDSNILSVDESHALFVNITGERDRHAYFLSIGGASEGLAAFWHRQMKYLIGFLIVTLCLLRILGYFFARKVAGPIERLSKISAKVAKGDLSQSVPVTTNDEIGELSKNFNHMIEGLREWEKIKMIEFEMEKGQKIQRDFLPTSIPQMPEWDIATCFFPAGKVSGDFYDVFKLPDGNVGLVIADVCDKGVGSALYMALFRSLIRVFAEQAAFCNPSALTQIQPSISSENLEAPPENDQIVRLRAVPFTNNYIAQTHGDEGMFATLFFGVLKPSTGTMYYINGGHEPLYIVGADGVKKRIDPTGPAVGLWPHAEYNIGQVNMERGDMLLGYTDGVTEARSPEDEIFSRSRLRSLIEQPYNSASDLLEIIKTNLFTFIDQAPRSDDVTMLAVQRATVL